MDELKPCPFCGSSNTALDYYEISCPQEIGTLVFCGDCGSYSTSIDRWGIRPIEDALRARIAELEALVARLVDEGEVLAYHLEMRGASENEYSDWECVMDEYQAMKGGEG